MKAYACIVLAWLLALGACPAQVVSTGAGPAVPENSIERWRSWRFGLFVHWGPVSLQGTEIGWSRAGERRGHRSKRGTQVPVETYDNLYRKFNPVKFDAREWVGIARAAGMKYMVFTTKHHDGFCNFDTALSDYKITSPASPYGKDIAKQLAEACNEDGLALGWYYSQPDWHHPDYRNGKQHERYLEYLHGQVGELLADYGKIDILWFDGLGGRAEDWRARDLLKLARKLQPGIVINNRAGLPGDHDSPEQRIGAYDRSRPWETCMTICRQWAWKPDDRMKSLKECIQTLLRVVGGDGNLLFNVGPMPDGRIEPRQARRLAEMGKWIARYKDGIYGTRGGPFKPGRWGASTCKGDKVYLYIMNWPEDEPLHLALAERRVLRAHALDETKVKVSQTPTGIAVKADESTHDPLASVIELTLDGPAHDLDPIPVSLPSNSLARGRPARASNTFRKQPAFAPGKAFDDDYQSRWATDSRTRQAWIEVDLGRPTLIGGALIDEAHAGRIRKFEIRCKQGDVWVTVHAGATVGRGRRCSFKSRMARHVRLCILEATEGPTLWEFHILPPARK